MKCSKPQVGWDTPREGGLARSSPPRHGWTCPGHPPPAVEAQMAGTRPAMTVRTHGRPVPTYLRFAVAREISATAGRRRVGTSLSEGGSPGVVMARLVQAVAVSTCRYSWPGQAGL